MIGPPVRSVQDAARPGALEAAHEIDVWGRGGMSWMLSHHRLSTGECQVWTSLDKAWDGPPDDGTLPRRGDSHTRTGIGYIGRCGKVDRCRAVTEVSSSQPVIRSPASEVLWYINDLPAQDALD